MRSVYNCNREVDAPLPVIRRVSVCRAGSATVPMRTQCSWNTLQGQLWDEGRGMLAAQIYEKCVIGENSERAMRKTQGSQESVSLCGVSACKCSTGQKPCNSKTLAK
ncbi:unnamed protein product [Gongylonema pulchrum]|uniref:Uncharacterized protein n=1 Tax=Gongylonema pulchrum TaxID=637853 RepID=A0A183ELY7_9BILA|nr:unnamed protein product [Gongylonema pulchrum]